MPELPEVETVRSVLNSRLIGLTLKQFDVYYQNLIEEGLSINVLMGQTIQEVSRIGKYLIFVFDRNVLVSHLRMEGKYYLTHGEMAYDKHIHARLLFDDGQEMLYHDTRKFGRMKVMTLDYKSQAPFCNLGNEPWDIDELKLYRLFKTKKIALKQALLDQHIICGLGNIYVNEVCFDTGLDPRTRIDHLSKKDVSSIVKSSQKILEKAIKEGGTTIRSYTSTLGVDGRFQQHLMVHGRSNQPCRMCGNLVKKTQFKGRGTYFCSQCQKRK